MLVTDNALNCDVTHLRVYTVLIESPGLSSRITAHQRNTALKYILLHSQSIKESKRR